jgi:hypothetical protein
MGEGILDSLKQLKEVKKESTDKIPISVRRNVRKRRRKLCYKTNFSGAIEAIYR